jgi:hypothetical protein
VGRRVKAGFEVSQVSSFKVDSLRNGDFGFETLKLETLKP